MKHQIVVFNREFPVEALANCLYRLGWPEIRQLAASLDEAQTFHDLLMAVRACERLVRVDTMKPDLVYGIADSTLELEELQWQAMMKMIQRVGWSTVRKLSESAEEAEIMFSAVRLFADALDNGLQFGEIVSWDKCQPG